jgi:hypothetical protein
VSPQPCYLPHSFTGAGGSQKPAFHNKDKLVINPSTGAIAQKSIIAQQARDAKKLKTRIAEEEHAKAAKKAKFDNLVTLEGLTSSEYVEMRKRNMYALPHNSHDRCFVCKEQELIMKEFYASLKKYPVCPQMVMDFSHFAKHSAYFAEAVWITCKLGLHALMKTQEHYNITLVHQFFATLVFGDGEEIPMTWMTREEVCHSNFMDFSALLGYEFHDATAPSGMRMHVDGEYYEKKKLAPLYTGNDKKIVFGGTLGLSQRSNILLRIFRASIATQAGNFDAIHGALVNLLAYSHEVYCKGETAHVEPLDVMDFIHKEINDCMVNKKTPLYAPFVIKLIRAQELNHPLLKVNLVEHKVVKLQRKAPTGHSKESFALVRGEDDDAFGEGVSTRRGPRMKHASNASSSSNNEFGQEFKKLNWFQRNVLCMNVDIHHKQYESYIAQKHMNDNQQALHKVFQASQPGYVESPPSSS